MKLIDCKTHGEVIAICTDSILLRYECNKCLQDQEETIEKDYNDLQGWKWNPESL